MPRATRLFRVFISSTFSDFTAEREALRERVFPRLRALCRARGAAFQAVDLRWGVSRAAAENHETMRICLGEIDRCRAVTSRPNFIALLGDRYGWRPSPERVPEHEFHEIVRHVQSLGDEAHVDLLSRSYRRDSNAVPPTYRLDLDDHTARGPRREVLDRLTALIRTAALALPFSEAQRRRYLASATEQEIAHRGLLDPGQQDGAAFCILRTIAGLPSDARGEGYIDRCPDGTLDQDAQARLAHLKARLVAGGRAEVRRYETRWGRRGPSRRHLARVAADTYAFLGRTIELELGETAWQSDPLDVEVAAHASFAEDRRRVFTGRTDVLRTIRGYLDGPASGPLVIHGASGSGKSTVMARAIAEAPADATVLYRFIGAVPGSTLVSDLLSGLCRQLGRLTGDDRAPASADIQQLVQEFRDRLTSAAARRRIVMFLDALDQLSPSYGARSLHWLPAAMPEHFHLVVSTITDDVFDALAGLVPASSQHELGPMSSEDGASLLDLWLHQDGRTLQGPQRAAVLDAFETTGLPLHLRLAAAEASTWPSYHPPVAVWPEVTGLIRALFTRLSAPAHHGAMLVARSVAYIAAGRSGVSEDELLDLLSADVQVMREFRAHSPDSPQTHSLPDVVWSRLYFDLAPYLTQRGVEGTSTLDFFHRQLRETVEHDQLTGAAKARRHRAVARYFDAQPLAISAKGAAGPNLRKLGELPFQLARAGLWRELEALLTSFAFLRSKIGGLGILATVEDFDIARQAALGSNGGIRPRQRRGPVPAVQDALRLSSGVLAEEPDMLAPQLLARLRGEHRSLTRLLRDAEQQHMRSWLNPLVASLANPGGPLNQAIVLDSDIETVSLIDGGGVLVGCSDGTLRLIDLERGIEAWRVAAHSRALVDVAYDAPRRRAVTVAEDGSVRLWALENRTRQLAFSTEGVVPRCVRVSPDGTWAFIGGRQRISESPYEEGVGSIRDLADGRERGRFARRDGAVSTAALSPDGSTVICGSSWGVVRMWDVATMVPIHEFRTNDGSVGSIAAASGETMLIGSGDQSSGQYNLRLWNRREWRELHLFKGHLWMINSVALTPDGRLGASGGYDATVRAWNLDERRQIACFSGHRNQRVRAVAIAPNGERVVSASESSLYDWSLDPGLIAEPFRVHDGRVTQLAAAADGSRAVSCAGDGTVAIWNLRTLRAERTTALGSERIAAVALDRRGRVASFGTADGAVVRLDLRHGTVKEILRGEGHGAVVGLFAGGRLAAVSGNGTISVVDLHTGTTLGRFARDIGKYHDRIISLALSADGKRIIATGEGFFIYAWDLATGSRVQRRNTVSSVPAFAATPDGRRGVSGTQFGRMFVWTLDPFRRRASLPHQEIGQNSEVSAVAITPDGRRGLSGGNDRMIRAWDLSSRRCLATFVAEDFTTCACAAGNDLFMAGSRNGAVHVLKVNSPRPETLDRR